MSQNPPVTTNANPSVGLPPIVDEHIRVLVLGSLPGQASLNAKQYYAHPRNAFWAIMQQLLGISSTADYESRIAALLAAGVGVWDVIERAARPGSLDSSIRADTVQLNDFSRIFSKCDDLAAICTNGRKAAEAVLRMQRNGEMECGGIALLQLPSTSPAYAKMPFEEKLRQWSAMLRYL